jgi:hypothetical protein
MFKGFKFIGLLILTITTIIISTGAVYGQNFSDGDLEGTWVFHCLARDAGGAVSIVAGTISFDSRGVVTGGTYSVSGHESITFTSGQYSLNGEGELSGFTVNSLGHRSPIEKGKMDEGKTIISAVTSGSTNPWSLMILTKKGGTFSASDLAGTWYIDAVISGTGLMGTGLMSAYGSAALSASGEILDADVHLSDGSTDQHSGGSLSLSGSGKITCAITDNSNHTFSIDYGQMDQGKSTAPLAANSDIGSGLDYFVLISKAGGSFSRKDMAGKWFIASANLDAGSLFYRYGTIVVDANGTITGGSIDLSSGGSISNPSGFIGLSGTGKLSGNFNFNGQSTIRHGKMDRDKLIIHGQELNGDSGSFFYMVRYSEPISLNVDHLNFSYVVGGQIPDPQEIIVTVPNGLTAWSAGSAWANATVSPASGEGSGTITVTVDPTGLEPGSHSYAGAVSVTDSLGNHDVSINLMVYSPGQTSAPFGQFDSPSEGITHQGSIPVTGWVLDDVGVEKVDIVLELNGTMLSLGSAIFVRGARPDVETAYPDYPISDRAGWGYMLLTNYLPNGGNGVYTLHAVAHDIEGNSTTLGTKTITIDNANAVRPFGALDTPGPGGVAFGDAFINFGWVLTPMPNSIAADGSTIDVVVDGVTVGNPVFGQYRSDIAEFFPGLANSEGAGGYFYLDTTGLDDGLHTIQWVATDSAQNTDGIGSRFFMVQNGSNAGRKFSAAAEKRRAAPDCEPFPVAAGTIALKKGFSKTHQYSEIVPNKNGVYHIVIRELEPLEIRLPSPGADTLSRFSGQEMVGVNSRPLPVGSTFDRENGVFYWQPGFGFLGNYRLAFRAKTPGGQIVTTSIVVSILPRSPVDISGRQGTEPVTRFINKR